MFHCLPDSAWADGNLAEAAGQLGKMVEHRNHSPPNPGLGSLGTPCRYEVGNESFFTIYENKLLSVMNTQDRDDEDLDGGDEGGDEGEKGDDETEQKEEEEKKEEGEGDDEKKDVEEEKKDEEEKGQNYPRLRSSGF